MKKSLFLFILLTCTISIHSFGSSAAAPQAITDAYVASHYNKREVKITMRDGIKLFTSIYEPKDNNKKHPILMNRTCYSVAPYGITNYARLSRAGLTEYIKNNYILVFQDVRGRNKSEGTFEDIRPFIEHKKSKKDTDEASDTYDTVDWLIHHTYNNGNVGVFGISYPGFYSTMAALSGHPAVKAVSPQAPVTDWFRGDDAHHQGALFLLDDFSFEYWFQYLNVQPEKEDAINPTNIVHNDVYTDYLEMGPVKNFTKVLGDSCTMWKNIINHPNLDQWWENRNVLYHCKNIKPAVMVVGGMFDAEDCYGALNTYKVIKRDSPNTDIYLVEGPWSHGAWGYNPEPYLGNVYFGDSTTVNYYAQNIEYPFFAYYLEGKGKKPESEARVFQTGENKWYNYNNGWPSDQAKTTCYYLNNNGGLTTEAPTSSEGETSYLSDPAHPVPYTGIGPHASRTTEYMCSDQRFATSRPDVISFATPTLTKSIKLAGEVTADLKVSISTSDADFIIKIIDVFPKDFQYSDSIKEKMPSPNYKMSGYQMLVREEVMRGKFRNSLFKPEPFEPGKITTVKFELPDVAHTFLPGHKLMIQIQSSCFPLIDRNPQTFCDIYKCDEKAFQKCNITVFHNQENASKIMLPVKN